VVLTGKVRLYEQKLIADRIAWTTPGVFEVDNEIQVVSKALTGCCFLMPMRPPRPLTTCLVRATSSHPRRATGTTLRV